MGGTTSTMGTGFCRSNAASASNANDDGTLQGKVCNKYSGWNILSARLTTENKSKLKLTESFIFTTREGFYKKYRYSPKLAEAVVLRYRSFTAAVI